MAFFSTQPPAGTPLTITPVSAFEDNYIWLLCRGTEAVVVDPGQSAPVESVLAAQRLTLGAILLTHHHADHVGGVAALLAARPAASIRVYGPAGEPIAGVTDPVREGDRVSLEAIGATFDVLDVPGHTRGHVAYATAAGTAIAGSSVGEAADTGSDGAPLPDGAPLLFCGDTLFAAGCGRLFEGTAAQMHDSLSKLAALPGATRVFCAHEYTVSNLRFALAVEPASTALAARFADANAARARGVPTLPSTIDLERATNPFLRVDEPDVRAAADRRSAGAGQSSEETFAALRRWKDRF